MPRALRFALLLAGFLPYAAKLPYMLHAWRSSPQDRLDWIFVLLFALILPVVWWHTRKRKQVSSVDYYALFLLIPALLSYGLFFYTRINAAQIASGVVIAFAVFWLIYGSQNSYRVLPAFGILALGITSSTYWISYFVAGLPLQVSGFAVKAIAAGILLLWLTSNYFREKRVRPGTLLFTAATGLALLLIWQNNRIATQKGSPVILALSEGEAGDFLSRRQEVTSDDIRFFGADSRIDKYYYVADNESFHVLALVCGENVNSIHPASHCLRSSGWTVHFESIVAAEIGENVFQVNEVAAQKQNLTVLLWTWYGNERFSTGNFINFRRLWNREEVWHIYQVMTPIRDFTPESRNAARLRMQTFVQFLAGPPL